MSKMPSKTSIPVSVPGKTRKFYTQDHLTTHSFMQPRPIFCREYVPGRNMQVKLDSFVRCNPLPVPVFGRAKVHNRAFFVPFRTVMPDFNDFYTNTPFSYSTGAGISTNIPSSVYFIRNNSFINYFIDSIGGPSALLVAGTQASHDITVYDYGVSGSAQYLNFTPLGIQIITLLESLGYKINWLLNDSQPLSAMPLLCFAKVMLDWYYPSAYVGDSMWNAVNGFFRNAVPNKELVEDDLQFLINVCMSITYNPDYLVNAWDNPVGPNNIASGLSERKITINDITNDNNNNLAVSNDSDIAYPTNNKPSNGTPFVGSNNAGNTALPFGVLTQYTLDALKSLTDYTKRHQLSGVRSLDRYLSELGINLTAEIMARSMYLGSQEFDLEFYDVFSHADTENQGGSPLGAYAGKGNAYGSNHVFDFDNGQEFGMFIVVNSIIPEIGYYQGSHRETLHVNALDFYHADFDHMAVQPISCREVYVTQDANLSVAGGGVDHGNGLNSQIFGFAPKYIEYNTPQDLQTGLYRIRTRSKLLPLYSLMRDLSFYEGSPLNRMKHNIGFVKGEDGVQYNRIFYVEKGNEHEDQMNAIHHFEVTQTDSTLPAYDTYEFNHVDDREKAVIEINGSKLN